MRYEATLSQTKTLNSVVVIEKEKEGGCCHRLFILCEQETFDDNS
jgi:hypothetical protein